MSRRRVVRMFRFDRILAFIVFVSFAVAIVCILLSLSTGAANIVIKKRTLYIVTYASCASESEAKLRSEECFARGGAGNIVPDGNEFYVAASGYASLESAASVAEKLVGARIKEITFEQLKFVSSSVSELVAEVMSLCYGTFFDELSSCAEERDKREISEAVAAERCKLCYSESARLLRLTSAQTALSTTSQEEIRILTAASELLSEAVVIFKGAESGDGALAARIRRAFIALALKTGDISKDLK